MGMRLMWPGKAHLTLITTCPVGTLFKWHHEVTHFSTNVLTCLSPLFAAFLISASCEKSKKSTSVDSLHLAR